MPHRPIPHWIYYVPRPRRMPLRRRLVRWLRRLVASV